MKYDCQIAGTEEVFRVEAPNPEEAARRLLSSANYGRDQGEMVRTAGNLFQPKPRRGRHKVKGIYARSVVVKG